MHKVSLSLSFMKLHCDLFLPFILIAQSKDSSCSSFISKYISLLYESDSVHHLQVQNGITKLGSLTAATFPRSFIFASLVEFFSECETRFCKVNEHLKSSS